MEMKLISLVINVLEVISICQATAAHSRAHQLVSAGRTNLGIYETVVTHYHCIGMSYSRVTLATKPMRRSTPAHDSQTSHAVASAGVDAAPQAGATAVTKEIA